MLMNEKCQEASVQMKSPQIINNMHHEKIKILRNQQEDNKTLREESFSWCEKKKVSGVQC
jgi:tRNA G37 N-methylase TrmD